MIYATPPSLPALTPWFAGLANRQYAACNLACIGDSITEGQHAQLPPTGFANRWVTRLAELLRAKYPTPLLAGGGRGYINAVGTGESSFTWPTVIAGTPGAVGFGPKGAGQQLNTTGQSITFSLVGDAADIMWTQTAGGGTFSWAVDGGTPSNIVTSGGSSVDGKLTRISLGQPGPHSLALTWVSGNSDIDGVIEYYGDAGTGIRVHDCGHFGWSTTSWQAAIGAGSNSSTAAIAALAPNAIIWMLGVNDQFAGIPPATFQSNLQTSIARVQGLMSAPLPANIIAMLPPRSGQSGFAYPWSQYTAAAQAIAAADTSGPVNQAGLATSLVWVADFTAGPRLPGADWDTYGIWQSGDVVHPSDKGHQAIADYLATFLTAS